MSQLWDRQGKVQKIPGQISEEWLYQPPWPN